MKIKGPLPLSSLFMQAHLFSLRGQGFLFLWGSIILLLVCDHVYGYMLSVVLLLAMLGLCRSKGRLLRLDYLLIGLLAAYPAVVFLNMIWLGGFSVRDLDLPSRFLLVGLLYLWLRERPFELKGLVLASGTAVGLAGLFGLIIIISRQFGLEMIWPVEWRYMPGLGPDELRFGGWDSPITFGQLAFLLMMIGLCPIDISDRHRPLYRIGIGVLVLSGLLLCLATRTRGVLFLFPLVFFYLVYGRRNLFLSGRQVLSGIGLLLLFVGFFLVTDASLMQRISAMANLFQFGRTHADQAEIDGSIAQRRQLLIHGITLAMERPVWGHGHGRFKQSMERLAEKKAIPQEVLVYSHAHMDLLNIQVELGLLGVLAILALFLGVSYLSIRHDFPLLSRYVIGFTVICWFLFGLGNVQLIHHKITVCELVLLVLGFAYGMNKKGQDV